MLCGPQRDFPSSRHHGAKMETLAPANSVSNTPMQTTTMARFKHEIGREAAAAGELLKYKACMV